MTFSIVGCDLSRGDWGVAVASKFPAVGAVVPWARAGVGAVATQSHANASYGPEGLAMMSGGRSAADVVSAMTGADDERDVRQVGMVDARGAVATFTGSRCTEWAGGTSGEGFVCQGNILTGPEVLEAMARAFAQSEGELVDRLMAAVTAGDDAGGDRRGRQSAALLVVREGAGYGGRNDRYVDLRVDDHPQAVAELGRLFVVFDREYLIRDDPLLDPTPELVSELQQRLRSLGRYAGEITGTIDLPTREGLAGFAGHVNLEAKVRTDDDRIYASVVRELRDVTPEVSLGG